MEITIYSKDGQKKLIITSIEYNGEWMGECFVTFDAESSEPIDFEVGDYLDYRGERFVLNYDPTVNMQAVRGTYGAAYKYEGVKFISLAEEMVNCDFLDYVLNENSLHFTGLPDFSFYAETVKDLADRLQANMNRYSEQNGTQRWLFEVSEECSGIEGVNISVNNISCFDALALCQSEFGVNYIIRGRKVTIGSSGLPASHIFKMGKADNGQSRGLDEIEKQAESDQKIVTRLRAYGSERNLPRRYYNSLTDADGKKLVPDNMAVNRLMLPTFPYETLDPYIDSPNIAKIGVREDTVIFDGSNDLEEIYPSIEGATADELKEAGYDTTSTGRLDEIVEAERVADDGEGTEENGEIVPETDTFTVDIKDIGFDIMDYLTDETPTISFKSGMLGGRDFEVCTGSDTKPQKIAGTGWRLTLKRVYDDSIKLFFPYSRYNAKAGDRFVLLGIAMPDIYVKMSSQRLLNAAQKYLGKNDYSRNNYSPKVDEIFMAEQHRDYEEGKDSRSLYLSLKEGDLLMFEEESLDLGLSSIFIDKLIIKEGDKEIPSYEITLREEKTVGTLERIQNEIDSLANGKGGNGGGYNAEQIRQLIQTFGMRYFLRKDGVRDTSQSRTFFNETISSADFREGMIGGQGWGAFKDDNGKSVIEVDNLHVRDEAVFNTLLINQIKAMAGMYIFTIADAELTEVKLIDNVYRCWFKTDENYISNLFRIDDVAYCHHYDAQNKEFQTPKYYKRRVIAIGEDYIDLAVNGDVSGSGVPDVGDTVITYGNYTVKARQYAIVLDVQGGGYLRFLKDLNSVNATGTEFGFLGYQPTTGERYFVGTKENDEYIEYVDGKFHIPGQVILGSDTGDGKSMIDYIKETAEQAQKETKEYVDAISKAVGEELQKQIDGKIETWFGDGEPSLSPTGYPLKEWEESGRDWDDILEAHSGDLYYDNETGYAYRFSKENGQWTWITITDEAITKALAAAKEKKRIFTDIPKPPYDVNDLWVNATYSDETHNYNNDILVCKSARLSGSFSIDDWGLASDYIDNSDLNVWGNTFKQEFSQEIKGQLDGKAETWYQATDPSLGWKDDATKKEHVGDLWYNTTNQTTYYWNGSEWKKQDVPEEVFDKIDGKADIYVSKPMKGYSKNDLWFLEGTYRLGASNDLYEKGTLVVATNEETREEGEWYASDWEKKDKYTDDTYAHTFDYLSKALNEGRTEVGNGLILSSLIALGTWEGSFQTIYSGINGIPLTAKDDPDYIRKGLGIAAWYGGDMLDKMYPPTKLPENPRYAQSLFRFDGTGYLAGGNITWEKDGSGTLAGGNIRWNNLGAMTFGNGINIDLGETTGGIQNLSATILGLSNTIASLSTLLNTYANMFIPVILNNRGEFEDSNWELIKSEDDVVAIHLSKGFYSDKFVSSKGLNPNGGSSSGGGGASYLYNLLDVDDSVRNADNGKVLMKSGNMWVAGDAGLNTSQLEAYLAGKNYATQSWVSNGYLPLTGGTLVGILTINSQLNITGNNGSLCANVADDNFFGPLIDSHNKITCGRTNARWSTVYSVNGNFSGSVTASSFTGNASSASQLQTTRTLWGQNFNGTDNVSGDMYNVGSVYGTNYSILDSATNPYFQLKQNSRNWYIQLYNDFMYLGYGVDYSIRLDTSGTMTARAIQPFTSGGYSLGSTSYRWNYLYSQYANVSTKITIGSTTSGSIQIGSATLEWDNTNQCLKVNTGFYSESFISSKGINNGAGGSGGTSIDLTKVSSHIIPAVTNTYDIGSSSFRWRYLFAHGLNLNPTVSSFSSTSNFISASVFYSTSYSYLYSWFAPISSGATSGNYFYNAVLQTMTVKTGSNSYTNNNIILQPNGGGVGIGTSATGTFSEKLRVSGDAYIDGRFDGGGLVYAYGDLQTDNNCLVDNKLGVGTLSPEYNLHVNGTGYISGILNLRNNLAITNGVISQNWSYGFATGSDSSYFWKVEDDYQRCYFGFRRGNTTLNYRGFVIFPYDKNSGVSEMYIVGSTNSPKVGINTYTPQHNLHVNGSAGINELHIYGTNNSTAYLSADTASNFYVNVASKYMFVIDAASNVVRSGDNLSGSISLGTAAIRWHYVYANYGWFYNTVQQNASDLRLKTVISADVDFIAVLLKLGNVFTYRYNSLAVQNRRSIDTQTVHTGIAYQNAVKAMIPDFTGTDVNGYGWVNFLSSDYQATMLGAFIQTALIQQTIRNDVNWLKDRMAQYEIKIRKLEERIRELERT